MDEQAVSLPHLRRLFSIPTAASLTSTTVPQNNDDNDAVYFCGNSLGLMPLAARALVTAELDVWAGRGVLGHFDHPHHRPWKDIADLQQVTTGTAMLVGAPPSQVTVMGALTSNLNTLLCAFYKPQGKRRKILFEHKAFPSDMYAFASQARLHGLDPEDALLPLGPKEGAYCLDTADILEAIQLHGDEIAVVLFSGVQYYTGQFFDIETITRAGHEVGAVVGWDLAHAVGNVPLELHRWEVDFACWCHYKYVNAGPGAIGGIFVHEQARYPGSSSTTENRNTRGLAGWWGHDPQTRFNMDPIFDPAPGAAGFQLSNPSVLNVVSLLASLDVFQQTSMQAIRDKSVLLTGFMEHLLRADPAFERAGSRPSFKIITPRDPAARGAQLSVLFSPTGVMPFVMGYLLDRHIVADERKPNVVRLSPVPLYNTFSEVLQVIQTLSAALEQYDASEAGTLALQQTT
ncbi:pyridoxal phosphate-dependent transferase [Protomyces lactucae-debilis]|uniref:Kynureninase n=1 Tax=Protomyces lactucae-debilis TaxID=2754530 RepID=A0A1Y2F968_PROLT|nr:pyridoxal phosphate-dependent transferase [Protomyces lactucae-debilis]ORY80458.1 pyridoxal phosphate-dependent transferase [Protomyces lactucae-debilis]